jgi:hypothetical protein
MNIARLAMKSLRAGTLLGIDTWSILAIRSPRQQNPEGVLLVRLDGLGDFVLWLSAAEAIIEFYRSQNRHITLLANSAWAEWAGELGLFHEVLALDKQKYGRNPRYRYQINAAVRRRGFSIAVQPTYSREWNNGDALVRVSGAQERIGSAGDPLVAIGWRMRIANRW